MTVAEHDSDVKLTTDTAYIALTGKPWGVCGEKNGENWPRYYSTALYHIKRTVSMELPDRHAASIFTLAEPHRRQAIIRTNAGILLTVPLGTNFSEILINIFSFEKNAFINVWKVATILFGP